MRVSKHFLLFLTLYRLHRALCEGSRYPDRCAHWYGIEKPPRRRAFRGVALQPPLPPCRLFAVIESVNPIRGHKAAPAGLFIPLRGVTLRSREQRAYSGSPPHPPLYAWRFAPYILKSLLFDFGLISAFNSRSLISPAANLFSSFSNFSA